MDSFGIFVSKIKLIILENLYHPHLFIRKGHEAAAKKSKIYRKYSENNVTKQVRRGTLIAFVVSFIVFYTLQLVAPTLFNKPGNAFAASNSKNWTSRGDFNNGTNQSTTIISGTQDSDDANVTLKTGPQSLKSYAVGNYGSYIIKSDGTLWAIDGYNTYGELGTTGKAYYATQIGTANNWQSVTASANYSVMAIRTDGTLWGWGRNQNGELGRGNTTQANTPTQIGTGTNWQSISLGDYNALAVKTDGTLWGSGKNQFGTLGLGNSTQFTTFQQVGSATDWKSVVTGYSQSFAIKTDGTLWGWGYNYYGELGLGNTTAFNTPQKIGSSTNWQSVSFGQWNSYNTFALKTDGTLWGWGRNQYGELGLGNTTQYTTPQQISGTTWKSVVANTNNVLATKTDGTLWGWGYNFSSELGLGNATQYTSPQQVGTGTNWASVYTSSGNSTMAVKTDSSVWGWGKNLSWELGLSNNQTQSSPVQIIYSLNPASYLSGITSIVESSNDSYALKSDGSLWSWGRNFYGELGFGSPYTQTNSPRQVSAITNIQNFSSDGSEVLAIKSDGTLWGWGNNYNGVLGMGTTSSYVTPVQIGTATNWKSVVIANTVSFAIKTDGTLWGCGKNQYGELGLGNTTAFTTFQQIGGATTWKTISSNLNNTLAVRSDGTLWGWGLNQYGELGLGNSTQFTSPQQVGSDTIWKSTSIGSNNVLSVKTDGTLWGWGRNQYGELGLGNTTQYTSPQQVDISTNWQQVTIKGGGSNDVLAIKTDGTLWGWGYNQFGELGISGLQLMTPQQVGVDTNWSQASIGSGNNTLALKSDGTVWGVGVNQYNELGTQNTLSKTTHAQIPLTFYPFQNNVYQSLGTVSGLKVDSGAGIQSNWGNISWTGTTPTNTAIKFRTRGSNLASPASITGDPSTGWTYWNNDSNGLTYYTITGSTVVTTPTRWLDVELTLISTDGASTPTLNDFTVTYNSLEAPTSPTSYHTDGTTVISASGYTNEQTVMLKASTTNMVGITTESLKPQVEIVSPSSNSFSASDTASANYFNGSALTTSDGGVTYSGGGITFTPSNYSYTSGQGIVAGTIGTISGLTVGSSYKWQVRWSDSAGRLGPWSVTSSIYNIEQTSPTLTSISVNSGATAVNSKLVNVTLTGAADTGGSGLGQMRFSNDGSSWSAWETYNATKSNWDLTAYPTNTSDGARTVYAQVKDNAGNTSTDFTFTEGFDNTTYKDAANTTADWNSGIASQVQLTSSSVIDQQQTQVSGAYSGISNIYVDYINGESFVPTASSISNVKVYLPVQGSTYYCPAIVIRSTINGSNLGTSDSPNCFNVYGWATYTFSPPISVTPGQKYYYLWTSRSSSASTLDGTLTDTYPNGAAVINGVEVPTKDMAFQTLYLGYNSPAVAQSLKVNTTSSIISKATLTRHDTANNQTIAYYLSADGGAHWEGPVTPGNQWTFANTVSDLRWKATLSTSDPSVTPSIQDVSVAYSINPAASQTVTLDTVAPTSTSFALKDPITSSTTNLGAAANKTVTVVMVPNEAGSGMASFQLSNDGSTWGTTTNTSGVVTNTGTWGTWNSAYSTTGYSGNWYISGADGSKTVYVRYKDNAGNVAPDSSWIDGVSTFAGTKQVYYQNISTKQWQTNTSNCASPQCLVGLDSTWPTNPSLVDPVTNPGVSFSLYPAQAACSAIGGRLPTVTELSDMMANSSTYGMTGMYWSATQGGANNVAFVSSAGTYSKTNTTPQTRCIRSSASTAITASITLDQAAPTTTGAITAGITGTNGWYKSNVTYTLTPADATSGVASTLYCTDTTGTCTPGSTYSTPITLLTESTTNHIRWASTDNAGNAQTVQDSGIIKVDTSTPITTGGITAGTSGSNGWYITNVTYTLAPQDTVSGIASTFYCADTAGSCTPSTPYSTALTVSTESATNHIRWSSTDNAGQVQTVQDSGVIKVDKTVPSVSSVSSINSNPNNTGNQTVSWSAVTDSGSSNFSKYVIQRKLSGGSYVDIKTETTQGTLTYADNNNLAEGTYYYHVISYDNAGNSTTSVDSAPLVVDKTNPGTSSAPTISPNPNTTGNQTISWSAFSDGGTSSGFQKYVIQRKPASGAYADIYTETSQGNTTYADNVALDEGSYYYRIVTYDNAGNSSTSADSALLAVDKTPPTDVANLKAYQDTGKTHDITVNNTNVWYPYASPYFEFSSTDSGSGIQTYKYCFTTDPNCTPTTSTPGNVANLAADLSTSPDGTYYFRVIAVDNAGQTSVNVTTFQYNFDKTPPTEVTYTNPAAVTSQTNPETQIIISWNTYPTTGRAPIQNYKLERVKYSYYGSHGWNTTDSNWSTGDGFAVFTTLNTTFTDSTDPNAAGIDLQAQTPLEPSTRYIYRISAKDTSNPDFGPWQSNPITALTKDMAAPTPMPTVTSVFSCKPSTPCLASDPVNHGANTVGFSNKIIFTASDDIGSGMGGYRIYRSTNDTDWTVVGFLPYQLGQNTVWYDNDTNNDQTIAGQKTIATPRLNDSSTYYYRVTAVDAAAEPNETELIPTDVNQVLDNWGHAVTPDVTAPTIPTGVVANAQGLDSTNDHQMINISWGASSDLKARSTDVVSGTITYHIYRSTDINGPWDNLIKTTTDLNFNDEGLAATTAYYYRVTAYDSIPNESLPSVLTESSTATTFSGEVPSVPSNIDVTSKKGNPNTDPEVGHFVTVSFNGSMSNAYDIVKYEVWRSTTNTTGSCNPREKSSDCWLRVNSATKVSDIPITPNPDDRGHSHSVTDSNLTDATTYYYRVRSQDNANIPGHPDQSNLFSGFTGITATVHIGWDITPDATAPELPSGLKVKDIHDDGMNFKRNIITWARITTPTRNGANDFKEYKIYRSIDGLTWEQICQNGVNSILEASCSTQYPNPLYNPNKDVALATNYYMDLIPVSEANQFYYYYVTANDDAGVNFTYPAPNDSTVINTYSNESNPPKNTDGTIVAVSLNPAIAVPSILAESSGLKADLVTVGVSTATVHWTTDQPCDSVVQFRPVGTSEEFRGISKGDNSRNIGMVTDHVLNLFGLKPNTSYEYEIASRNFLGNPAVANGTALPTLTTSGFNVTFGTSSTTTSTAEITWTTNLDASSAFIEYQLQKQPGDESQGGTAGVEPTDLSANPRNHRVVIKGLRSNRTYTYKVKSISTDGFIAETDFLNFKTRNFDSEQFTIAPSSSNVAERNITSTTAQIVWTTGVPTTSWIDYSTVPGIKELSKDNIKSVGNNDLTTQHIVVLDGLIPGTKYYYRCRVKDSNEIEFTSQEYSFTAVLKPKISNLSISDVKPYSVTISWETNVDTETIMNWGKTKAYGEKRGKNELTKNHKVMIDGLDDNNEYHFQILAHDDAGNEVADDDKVVRTPLDTEGPKIENVKTDILPMGASDTAASVVISWNTNKPASTLVEYDEGIIGGHYSKSSIEDKTLNLSHTVIVKELKPASSYHYHIVTADKRGNTTKSNDFTFITPSQEKSILQLILKSLEETFSWTKNVNQFFGSIGKRMTGK